MTRIRPSWTLASLLWFTAFLSLILASVSLRADRGGVFGVTLCGGLITLAAAVGEPRRPVPPLGQSWPGYAMLAISGGFELFALLDLRDAWATTGTWYAAALFQAATAALLARRREPRDAVFLCVMAFHSVVNIPTAVQILLRLLVPPPATVHHGVSQMMLVTGLIMMPLFVCLSFIMLLLEAHQPPHERHLAWSSQLVSLLSLAIILARWSAGRALY